MAKRMENVFTLFWKLSSSWFSFESPLPPFGCVTVEAWLSLKVPQRMTWKCSNCCLMHHLSWDLKRECEDKNLCFLLSNFILSDSQCLRYLALMRFQFEILIWTFLSIVFLLSLAAGLFFVACYFIISISPSQRFQNFVFFSIPGHQRFSVRKIENKKSSF